MSHGPPLVACALTTHTKSRIVPTHTDTLSALVAQSDAHRAYRVCDGRELNADRLRSGCRRT